MGINVQYGVDPAAIVQAGVLGGAGQLAQEYRARNERYQLQSNEFAQQSKMQANQIRAQQAAQANQIRAQQSMQQIQIRAQQAAQAGNIDAQLLLREYDTQAKMDVMEKQNELFEDRYTFQQEAQLKQFSQAEQQARDDPTLTEPQRQELIWNIQQQRAGVRPSKMPIEEKPPPPMDQYIAANVWTEPSSGVTYTRGPRGEIKATMPSKDDQITYKDWGRIYSDTFKQLTREDANGNVMPPTPEAVENYIRGMIATVENLRNMRKGESMTSPEASGESAPQVDGDMAHLQQIYGRQEITPAEQAAWKARKGQVSEQRMAPQAQEPPQTVSIGQVQQLPVVQTEADYLKIPPGGLYRTTDGKVKRKGGG